VANFKRLNAKNKRPGWSLAPQEEKEFAVEDFKGMSDQDRDAANLILNTGGLLVKVVENYRDAIEKRLKAVLVKQGNFDPRPEREGGDKHHKLRKLAIKTGIKLKEETLLILEKPALQQTQSSNVSYSGTQCVIDNDTWSRGDTNQQTQALIVECNIYKALCDEVWTASEHIFQ